MRQHADAFAAAGAQPVVVTFHPPELAAQYQRELGLPFPCLADPGRHAYRLYGLERAGLVQAFHPEVLSLYLRLLVRGRRLRRPRGDILQLGGDFVIDPAGRLSLVHYSRTPADRPTIETLLDACRVS